MCSKLPSYISIMVKDKKDKELHIRHNEYKEQGQTVCRSEAIK